MRSDLVEEARPSSIDEPKAKYRLSSVVQLTEWRRALLISVLVVLGLRVALSAWAAFILATNPDVPLAPHDERVGVTLQTGTLAAPWQREDALWYEMIATRGYGADDGTTVFLPLLPLLMKVASLFTLGDVALAGLLVSLIAATFGLALLYRLAMLDWGERVAMKSVLYLALFPMAFFLLSSFTESLFLVLTVGAFWYARKGNWWLVALLAGLAGLTKAQGALLCLPLAVEVMYSTSTKYQVPSTKSGENRKDLVLGTWYLVLRGAAVVLAAPLATLGFFAYVRYVVGDPLFWSERVLLMWDQRNAWPWETVATAVGKAFSGERYAINNFDLIVLVLFGVLTVATFRLRTSYGLLALTVLAPSLFRVYPVFPLMSLSRYALVAFPCFIALALWAERRGRVVQVGIIVLWVTSLLMWSSQFVLGHWVG